MRGPFSSPRRDGARLATPQSTGRVTSKLFNSRHQSTMLPRRLMGCLRLGTIGSRAERLAFYRTSILASDRFASTTPSGRGAHGDSSGCGNRRATASEGSSVSGGRHITSTAVSGRGEGPGVSGGATSSEEVLVQYGLGCARHVFWSPTLRLLNLMCCDRERNE